MAANGTLAAITYDGDGNRVAKTVSGVTTKYLVDELNPTGYAQVVEELSGGVVTRQYTYGTQRISEAQWITSTWTPSFYGYDEGGNVRQLTNAAGAVTDTNDFDAFGNLVNYTGSTPNQYMYRGEEWDSDLGLYYLRARYYNPTTGRFMARDRKDKSLINPSDLHKYLYATDDPMNRSDPSGQSTLADYRYIIAAVALGTTGGLLAARNGINCALAGEGSRAVATVSAGPFGYARPIGPCTWQGLKHYDSPTIYPLPYPFPISTPAPTGPYRGPGSCDSGGGEEWHHIVPQAERAWAEGCGFNIDQAGLGMCIKGSCHDQVHGNSNGTNWNAEWKEQIDTVWGRGECPSNQELVDFARSLAVRFAEDILCE